MLYVVCCMLHVVCCMLMHLASCMLYAACCILHAVSCMLYLACCILHAEACCMLYVAFCMLYVACWMARAPRSTSCTERCVASCDSLLPMARHTTCAHRRMAANAYLTRSAAHGARCPAILARLDWCRFAVVFLTNARLLCEQFASIRLSGGCHIGTRTRPTNYANGSLHDSAHRHQQPRPRRHRTL